MIGKLSKCCQMWGISWHEVAPRQRAGGVEPDQTRSAIRCRYDGAQYLAGQGGTLGADRAGTEGQRGDSGEGRKAGGSPGGVPGSQRATKTRGDGRRDV